MVSSLNFLHFILTCALAKDLTAFIIGEYPVHLHKLPENASLIVSSLISLFEFNKLTPATMKPGVQYPHYEAFSFEKATCKG